METTISTIESDQRRCDAALSLLGLGLRRQQTTSCTSSSPRSPEGGQPHINDVKSFQLVSSLSAPTVSVCQSTPTVQDVDQVDVPEIPASAEAILSQYRDGEHNLRDIYAILASKARKKTRCSQSKQNKKTECTAAAPTTISAERKNNVKAKDPKRDTTVPFDEMTRLMRVYGPTKALRNRTSKDNGKVAKPDSIRRKFYRWFPDFHVRFVKTDDGWYAPKAGHEAEMQYRESMRSYDKVVSVRRKKEKSFSCGVVPAHLPALYHRTV